MGMTRFQKLAVAALVSVLLLMFVGATVRVTGAGMGCPDWPTCWGCLIPPTSVDGVDFSKLPIEKFQRKAERMGRDPAEITEQSLRAEFNPRHVWTEFVNRLTSLPVGFFSLATFIAAFGQRAKRPLVFWMAFASLATVLINAWMGARVVYSGLEPGVLTAHLALAMALLGMLAYCAWRGTDQAWRIRMAPAPLARLRLAVIVLLVSYVSSGSRPAAGSDGLGAEAVARRIQPLARVVVRDASEVTVVKTGEQAYQLQCSACHAAGLVGAPKLGDVAAWAPRIATGYETLWNSALKGKNAMSAQSGGALSDFEIGRAVVYMANQGGAKFDEPKAPAGAASAAEPASAAAANAASAVIGAVAPTPPSAAPPPPPAAAATVAMATATTAVARPCSSNWQVRCRRVGICWPRVWLLAWPAASQQR